LIGVLVILMTVLISFVAVRIGAVALELTGLDRAAAGFQAISAFTGTGFTTQEAELVVSDPRRRRILQILMVAGNAGIVTVIAGMVQTLQTRGTVLLPVLQLAAVVILLYLLYRIVISPRISRWVYHQIRGRLAGYVEIETVNFEELLRQQEQWGVFRVRAHEGMTCVGKALGQSRLRDQGITVLTIERGHEVIPSPGPNHLLLVGDAMIVYGRLDRIEQMMGRGTGAGIECPGEQEVQAGVAQQEDADAPVHEDGSPGDAPGGGTGVDPGAGDQ